MRSMTGQSQEDVVPLTVSADLHQSVKKLMAGNDRYLRKLAQGAQEKAQEGDLRRRLSTMGQSPWCIVVSCSDSRCPVERLFDASPGDLFVIRVAGNICGSPVGGVIGSAEYGVEHLKSPVLMVLGHTKCGAVSAAVRCTKDGINPGENLSRNLGIVVGNIQAPAAEALQTLDRPETPDQIEHAIKLNVLYSMEQLLQTSTVMQQAVRTDQLQIQGGIYDITTGKVTFLGKHPRQNEILANSNAAVIRTGLDAPMPAPEVLKRLQQGNARYVIGHVDNKLVNMKMRQSLVQQGQRPMAIILGCADSRIALDHVFDTNPGDLFVVRNAGSVCGATSGGLIGSMEYGVGHLKAQMLVVLGHTSCGAVAAAMDAHLAKERSGDDVPDGLKALLERLAVPVKMAAAQCSSNALADKVALAIELNVWHTIEQLLANSKVMRDAVAAGSLQIQGGIYDLESGKVTFMGEHAQQSNFLQCADEHPSAMDNQQNGWNKGDGVTKRPASRARIISVPTAVVPTNSQKPLWTVEKRQEEQGSYFSHLAACIDFQPSWYVNTKHGKQHIKEVILDQNNWIAGVTVALVSVPLSISLGIASGTTPMRGVATAVFGGLCAGLFGSSDYNIVGPAGALSGMMMSYVVKYGEDCLPWISLISSVICALCALLRLDAYMLLMPTSVFEGFTVGVALIIGLNQINFACGLIPGEKHSLFVMNIIESIKTLGETKPASLIVFLLSAPTLWFLMRKVPKIPWTVILPVVSIPLGVLCDEGVLGFDLLTLKSKYGVLKPELVVPLKPSATFIDLLIPSFSVAIVAVLETLISAKIAAGRVDRDFNITGEMRGLVIAHAVCGATGAMAPTGVFVRTSLNTSLGATHRFSQTLNAVVVALISLALMPLFSYLPQATIAAILVVAAIRMTPVKYMIKLWGEDKGSLALCLVTALICVGEDPVIGLAVGMMIALLAAAKKMMKAPFVDITNKLVEDNKSAYRVVIKGALTYVNAETFIKQARKLPNASEVTLDLLGVRQLDHDSISALGKVVGLWVKENEDCKVKIKGVGGKQYNQLTKFDWFTKAECENRVELA
eukprot:CAMPEP_0115220330 /NCGR_PEP_ID=MMETSP0270-20121206/27390_1 /TAXON_ID=71861 /ORGANISM="Scrippsiella trochoidea, Strain CCMP3099" /LENGTH=1070 /DNA_ID=CAMNT_0002634379 /DNA_START=14 /DNA_END=3226 /DNA_ORIENTATION=+